MIYEKNCPTCGTEFETKIKSRIYCCRTCANKSRYQAKINGGSFNVNFSWKKQNGKWVCPYREGVGCYTRNCYKCGWNPEVAKARTKKYMEEHYGTSET